VTGMPRDPRLDPALRKELQRRDPGEAAPPGLRSWVLSVPDGPAQGPAIRLRREVAALLSLAAMMLLVVIGLTTIRHLEGPGVAGSSVPADSAASQSPVPSAGELFDPSLEGPGVSSTDDLSPAILVIAACGVLGVLSVSARGWRRTAPALIGALLAGWALVAALAPISIGFSGYGQGLNVVRASGVPGSSEELLYELAPPNGRFTMGILINAGQPLPVRIEGIVSPSYAGRDSFLGMVLTAVWIDDEPHGGMSGPARPFAPFDVPREGQAIWLVGRAGGCAFGPAFDPLRSDVGGFAGIESIDLRVSVLGWPRTISLALPFRLVEPHPQSCPGVATEPTASTSAEPSSH
jgi:hypothetical protein